MPTSVQPDPVQDDSDSGLGGEDVQLFPELKIRGSPKHLAWPIKRFNACQKNAVRALGLGDMLDFQVEGIPKSMCRWLISNFDPTNMCLSLENGLVLPVTEEDVHYTLGLPQGSVVITKRKKDDVSDTLKEWRSKFDKEKHDITPAMIATKVRSLLEGDVWFKRHFAVLVVSVLGGTMTNGYANQLIFHHFEDVDGIKNLNWCKFILESLVERHAQWVHNPDKQFSGPIVFLLLHYVDRVVHSDRVVPRLVPSLRGWSSRHLKARQLSEIRAGGFGRGIIKGHIVVATDHQVCFPISVSHCTRSGLLVCACAFLLHILIVFPWGSCPFRFLCRRTLLLVGETHMLTPLSQRYSGLCALMLLCVRAY
nr:uncharacterized protein LOC109191529 [Ipomoea batatas]